MSLVLAALKPEQLDDLALADERVSYTWRQVDPLLNRATNAIRSLGTPRVTVFAHNSAEAVMAYFASFLGGVSSVPASFHLTAGELAYILTDSHSGALFVGPETMDAGLAAAAQAHIGTIIGWRCPTHPKVIPWEDWIAKASAAEPPTDVKSAPHLHYTSGTTGKPKGTDTPPAYIPPAKDMAELAAILRGRATPSPGIAAGPLYHTGPLTQVRQLIAGVALITQDHFDPETFLAAIARYKVAGCVLVPTHFARLLALPAEVRAKYDVSSMKRLAHTGAACPRDVKQAMIDWFGPVLTEAYGGTEAGSTHMITSPEWLKRPGSVGRATPGFETVIVDEAGKPLGPNQVGRVFVRDLSGRGVVYHNDPGKTADAHIAPGVFTLGEVGYVDDEGYLFITDRVSDMIVSGGVNIYPAEAEQVLLRHPAVGDVAVIGVPNKDFGEEAKALIVPRDAAHPPAAEELNAFCRATLAGYKCPRSYEIVGDIGRNAMGKVNKRQLRQKYWPTERTIG